MTESYPNVGASGARPMGDPTPLLAALQRLGIERLLPALDRALGKVDDYLFDATQNADEDILLSDLRAFRRVRSAIGEAFEQDIVDGFRRLRDNEVEDPTGDIALSLVSDDALEQQLANEQLSDSLGRKNAPGLEMLERRLAALLMRDAIGRKQNPLAPDAIADSMQQALASREMLTVVRVVAFKFFERELGAALDALYERANDLLADGGVLPDLRPSARAIAEAHLSPQASPAPAPMPGPGQEAMAAATQMAGAPGMAYGHQPQHAVSAASPADQMMFANLLGLLQTWRGGNRETQRSADATPLRTPELLSVLSLLQQDLPASLSNAMHDSRLSLAEGLRRELVRGARRLGIRDKNLRLDELDEDAVDLVGMLFDVLLEGRQFPDDMREKIGRMLVPYVKVAIKDRRMFLFRDHPARKLLNTVAEACEGNKGEGPQERELLDRVDTTIDRLVAGFNEDMAIFETLEQELRAFLGQYRKRIDLIEKRVTDAQRGRERLEYARSVVAGDITRLRGERKLPGAIGQFLDQHASHHLVQVALREGQASPRYESAILAVGDLLRAFDQAELQVAPAPLTAEPLLTIFASSGIQGDAGNQAVDLLRQTLTRLAAGEDAADIDCRMIEQPVPVPPVVVPEPALELVGGNQTLDFDPSTVDRLRKLEIGNWVELATQSDIAPEPAKVSWVSPISGRLLFVNRRGIRVLVASLEELAALAKQGQLTLRDADNAFEDAMHQVAGRLRGDTND